MAYPFCPECGSPLSVTTEVDEVTGNIIVNIFCEGPAEDEYSLKIDTHLCNEALQDWDVVGSEYKITMKLEARTPDPYYKSNWETMKFEERE